MGDGPAADGGGAGAGACDDDAEMPRQLLQAGLDLVPRGWLEERCPPRAAPLLFFLCEAGGGVGGWGPGEEGGQGGEEEEDEERAEWGGKGVGMTCSAGQSYVVPTWAVLLSWRLAR